MRSPEEVFQDFSQRKRGILNALTTDQQAFFDACDPTADNLVLYGNADGAAPGCAYACRCTSPPAHAWDARLGGNPHARPAGPGSWEVALPAEEVPPEAPEPALGVNFARDGAGLAWLCLLPGPAGLLVPDGGGEAGPGCPLTAAVPCRQGCAAQTGSAWWPCTATPTSWPTPSSTARG